MNKLLVGNKCDLTNKKVGRTRKYFGENQCMLLDECPAELELFAFGPVLNCYHSPVSLVGRFRLGGQVLLGIENLSLAPRWAETISTTKALVTQ